MVSVEIQAPLDVHEGDVLISALPGKARRRRWAMALSPDDLAKFAFDGERNSVYVFASLLARYHGLKGAPLNELKFSEAEHLALLAMAQSVVTLALDGNKTAPEKAASVAAALGFTKPGSNAFGLFESDGEAHFAEHQRTAMQKSGARYVDAMAEIAREASAPGAPPLNARTVERIIERGKKRGARPFADPAKPRR